MCAVRDQRINVVKTLQRKIKLHFPENHGPFLNTGAISPLPQKTIKQAITISVYIMLTQ